MSHNDPSSLLLCHLHAYSIGNRFQCSVATYVRLFSLNGVLREQPKILGAQLVHQRLMKGKERFVMDD